MNKIFLLLILVAISNFAYSQQSKDRTSWHLTVLDSATEKGIPGVTISVNNKRYFITDDYGKINFNKKLLSLNDNLIISCVGYKTVSFRQGLVDDFHETIIKLSASEVRLKEVKIRPLMQESKVGDIKKSYRTHRISNPNESLLQFIPNERQIKGVITSIEYVLHDELHGIEKPFRVRLYTKSKGSLKPDQELIEDTIIVYNPYKKRILSVDISKYNIQFPKDGVIAVFETLPPSYYGKDSIFYWGYYHLKMPGLEMDSKKKDDYPIDHDKIDRGVPYSMVGPPAEKLNFDEKWYQWYVFTEDHNFAITLTISQ